jgi:DNA-binding transcriptional MocR family regulator
MIEHLRLRGKTASGIAGEIESAIREGALETGATLPSVRALANELAISPMTVVSAYGILKNRGLLVAERGRGTRIAARPPLITPGPPPLPHGVRNLADGNPDPTLVPSLAEALPELDLTPRLYGERTNLPRLLDLAGRSFERDGVPAQSLAVTGGGFDAIERVLQAQLRNGDRIAVEDPGYPRVFDIISALGLLPIPVPIDERGLEPAALERALAAGAQALIITPRAQNPTGAALDEERAIELQTVLARYEDALVVEDDYVGAIAGLPAPTVAAGGRSRWAVVRSVSKSLGPDLRLAVVAGDPTTIARVEGRQLLGTGWVSHILQQLVAALLSSDTTTKALKTAEQTYRRRREALLEALADAGIAAHGRSGLNVWVPVAEESRTVSLLLARGWAVAAGERFRRQSPPAVRITTATLGPEEAEELARNLAETLGSQPFSHAA